MSSSWMLDYIVLPELVAPTKKQFLDVACGLGKWGIFLKKHSYASRLIGLDIWKPYLKTLKKRGIYDELVLADAAHLPFIGKSFDVVVACEVIEHLPKQVGISMCKQCEEIAREKIILSTPNFPYLQFTLRGNPFEQHISVWKETYFKKVGYEVRGIGIKFTERYTFSMIPLIGRLFYRISDRLKLAVRYTFTIAPFLRRAIPKKLSHFAELIVAVKLLTRRKV